jgi:hypothetical protein
MSKYVVITTIVIVGLVGGGTALALDGLGTQENPWLIQSLEDFNDFAADANYWAGFTRLETDVNLAGITYTTAVIAPDTDTGALFQGTAFTGLFDGNDHVIHKADVYMPFSNYVGLFGYVGPTSRIHSLVLEGLTITGETHAGGLAGVNEGSITDCSTSGSVEGTEEGDNIGGLVGSNLGSITYCYSTCSVNAIDECDNMGGLVGFNSGSVTDCYASGPVDGSDCHRLGGLVGINEGSLDGCYSTGSVRSGSCGGGLVGRNLSGTITNCYATGRVEGLSAVGGLLAMNRGIVSDCYSTGDVNGVDVVGGLVGFYLVGITSNCYSTGNVSGERTVGGLIGDFLMGNVSNCHSTGNVKGSEYVGGLIGHTDINGEISNCFWDIDTQTHGVTESIGINDGTATNVAGLTTAQMQTRSTFTDADWDFINVWNIGENQTYPYLRTVSPSDINKDHITDFFDIRILCDQWLQEE